MILVTFKYVLTWSIVKLVLLSKATEATPVVTLTPSPVYISIGGSLTLTCQVNQDVGLATVYFKIGSLLKVWVTDITNCGYIKADPSEAINPSFNYSITCSDQRSFTMIKYGVTSSDHRQTWYCQMTSAKDAGPCFGGNNPCISPGVTAIIRIPVTTVQLMNGSGQTLSSSVNIVRGQSTGIRCSTAPSGSRPRATFQWYYRQGNQSPVQIEGQSISPTPGPESVSDLLISYSTWTLTGNASYQDMYIYCQAQDETSTGNYTKSDEVQLNIVYPPVVLLSTYQSIYNVTEGMQNFVFICKIIEANPLPQPNSYSWFHMTATIQGQTSPSYTLPSVQRSDAGEYKCTARNDYGYGTSNSLNLIVQYPPNIIVILTGSTQQNQTAIQICGAMGVPAETTFYPWVQMWGDVVIRTGLQGQTNSTHSVLTLDRLSLESMGTYICTATNGIMGINGTLSQTGSESLHVKGAASILTKNARFVGEISFSANMSISFYCDPPVKRFAIWKNSKEIMNTSRTITSLSNNIVNYIVHNKTIQLNAQKAHFVILNVTVEDFDIYTLVLTNSIDSTSFQFHLDAFAPPYMPKKFVFIHIKDGRLVFGIEKGFNGGSEQTFVVEYQPFGLPDTAWSTIFRINETDLDDPFSNGTYYIKIPNIQDGHYIFRVYAENRKGNSSAIEGVQVEIKTAQPMVNRDVPVGAVVGGVVGAVVLVIAIIAVVFVIKKRTLKPKLGENMKREAHGSKGPEYINTAFRSDINTTEYEALQSGQTGASQYEPLNDPKSNLNQSTDISISADPRLLTGEMFYDKLQPCETNEGHMYSSLSSPRLDDGENKFYENTVMSTKYIHE